MGGVATLARTCKMFRNRRPHSALTGEPTGEPTPFFRGRLRCAVIASRLSRRRPRVRVPSTPPTKGFYRNELGLSVDPVSNISPKPRGLSESSSKRIAPSKAAGLRCMYRCVASSRDLCARRAPVSLGPARRAVIFRLRFLRRTVPRWASFTDRSAVSRILARHAGRPSRRRRRVDG